MRVTDVPPSKNRLGTIENAARRACFPGRISGQIKDAAIKNN